MRVLSVLIGAVLVADFLNTYILILRNRLHVHFVLIGVQHFPTTLSSHVLTHTEVKRFKCSECSYQSKYSIHLSRHMLSHTGENKLNALFVLVCLISGICSDTCSLILARNRLHVLCVLIGLCVIAAFPVTCALILKLVSNYLHQWFPRLAQLNWCGNQCDSHTCSHTSLS